MPDINISVTLSQAQRVSASFGPKPEGMTHEQWIVFNTKSYWKTVVRRAEAQVASNSAHDAAVSQVETDFNGF